MCSCYVHSIFLFAVFIISLEFKISEIQSNNMILFILLKLFSPYSVIENVSASQVNCQAIEMQLKLIYEVNSTRTICRA